MKIAVTHANGEIFQHFGHCESFKVYEVEEGKILAEALLLPTQGGHSALSSLLHENSIDVLICGGIGGGAINTLTPLGVKVFGGVTGSCDNAVNNYLAGTLDYNPNVRCSHHDSHHGEGHTCHGANGCGEHK